MIQANSSSKNTTPNIEIIRIQYQDREDDQSFYTGGDGGGGGIGVGSGALQCFDVLSQFDDRHDALNLHFYPFQH